MSSLATTADLPLPAREPGLPLLGDLLGMLSDAPGTLLRAARSHPEELFAIRLGPVDLPVVSAPDHLHEVLVERAGDYRKAGMWEATRPLLGNGLVTSDGATWLRQRRLLQPLFSQRHVASLAGTMAEAVAAQADALARREGPVELGQEMTLLTQRVLLRTLLGGDLEEGTATRLGQALGDAFGAMHYQIFLFFLPSWVPRPKGRIFREAVAEIDAAMAELVAARRAQPRESDDVLTRLLGARDPETGEGMSDTQIRDELVTLYVAGLDTSAVTLTWLLWLLDQNPGWDARLRAEVAALGGRLPAAEDVAALPLCRQAIFEAMRLYPPAWIFPRYTPEGSVVGGRRIAAGSSVLVSPWLAHRDPRSWDAPETFDPDRFSAARSAGRPRMAFIPFGAGSRQCLGMHFAIQEMQIALAVLLQRFRPRLVEGHRVVPASASTLKPKGGMPMVMRAA